MIQKDVQVYGTILVSSENKILLVLGRHSKKWSFPKGHPNDNEIGYDCARRETNEETGIMIPNTLDESIRLATGIYYVYRMNGQPERCPIDKNEVIDTKWWTIHEMNKRLSVNIDVSYFLKNYGDFLWKNCSYNNNIICHNNNIYEEVPNFISIT